MSKLSIVAEPKDFFRELLIEALHKQKLRIQAETEFYLVSLLSQFISTDNLYIRDKEGHRTQEPLVVMIKEAIEETHPEGQRALFRKVGDVSLYVAGYFQDSLTRKLVDVDYYIDMGGSAYKEVSARVSEKAMKKMYAELALKFGDLVGVFAEMGDQTTPKTEKNLLRLYELWNTTQSKRAKKLLEEAGIVPVPPHKPGNSET